MTCMRIFGAAFAASIAAGGAGGQASPPSAPAPARPPRHIAGAIVPADYPPGALRRGTGGASEVSVAIGPDGRATGCTIVRTSGNAELDRRACTIITTRFRWEPAADAAGRPVASTTSLTIDWQVRTTTVPRRPPRGWQRGARRAREARAGPQPPQQLSGTILDSDYPAEAIRARAQGDTAIEVAVDALGRPSACTILSSSGHRALDEKSCDMVVTRFVWAPGRDEAGQPVAGTVRRTIRWRLPGRPRSRR